MRLKILRTVGKKDTVAKNSDNPNSLELPCKPNGSMYQEGEIVDLDEEDAQKFIACGVGEAVQSAPRRAPEPKAPEPEPKPKP
jgi:hypothetical protein